jgi:FkbM family methyltransferase
MAHGVSMFLSRVLNKLRYQRCVQLFRRPLWSHLLIAARLPFPMTLELTSGDKLRAPNGRRCRHMFDTLLEILPNPFPVTVADGLVEFQYGGQRFALRPSYADFYIFKEIMVGDDYQLNSLPRPLGTVVDLGTNIGLFSLKIAATAERVIGVEPVRENFQLAQRMLDGSGLAHKVTLRKAAVAAESNGTVRIFASNQNAGGHSMFRKHAAQWGGVRYEDVPAISLSDLFEQEGIKHCSLLKCDVEGAEFDVIANTPLELLSSIDRILMEVHLNVINWDPQKFNDFTGRLAAAGFRIEHDALEGRWGRRKRGIWLRATHQRETARRAA